MRFYSPVVLLVFAAVLFVFVACDSEGCPSPGDLKGGDNGLMGGVHEQSHTPLQVLKDDSDKCWESQMGDRIEELRGLNDTKAIRAVMIKFCQRAGVLHECLERVSSRGTCLSGEERTRLRLHSLFMETVMSVGCQNHAALNTDMRTGMLRIRPQPSLDEDDIIDHCYSKENKDLGVQGEGVNGEMIYEYRYFQAALHCLGAAETEGQEDAVRAGIAMGTAILDRMVCIDPTDGSEVLCKTVLHPPA